MSAPLTLYGVPASYFSGKARAYLRKQGIAFEEYSSAHPGYGERIFPAIGRFVLPVLETPDGTIVQDSDDIIGWLEAHAAPRLSCHPPGPVQRVLSHFFNLAGSEGLIRMAMHYRWSYLDRQDPFIAAGFIHGIAPESPADEADALARPMMGKLSGYLGILGVNPDSIPHIEASYHRLLDAFQAHLAHHPCLFGAWPSLGDYGLYGPLFAHLGRDPVPAFEMKQRAPRVFRWTERVGAPNLDILEYPSYPHHGFLPDDAVPDTLLAIGQVLAGELLPEITDQVDAFNRWASEQTGGAGSRLLDKPHKRAVGTTTARCYGIDFTSGVSPYRVYLLQRLQDALAALDDGPRQRAAGWFEAAGLTPLFDAKIDRRIARRGNVEVWESD